MSAEVGIEGKRLEPHRLRAAVLGEVHARPFTPIEIPRLVPQPGPLLVAVDLHLLAEGGDKPAPERLFERSSLAIAGIAEVAALMASDFQCDPAGFVRILVVDRGLGPERAGAAVQRVLEL